MKALLVALLGSSCVSIPDAPRVPAEVLARIEGLPSPAFRAHLSCEPSSGELSVSCEATLDEVRRLLSRSPWFASLDAEPEEASLLLAVEPLERTPRWAHPGHNAGTVLFALVFPVHWKDRAGYRITAALPGGASTARIDTRREGNAVFWGLAPLLNLSRDRSFRGSERRELDRLLAQLLPPGRPGPAVAGRPPRPPESGVELLSPIPRYASS